MSAIVGNKCGHVKDFPRYWQCSVKHKSRYGTLEYAKACLLHYYHYPKKLLKRLLFKKRHRRSERREAIVLVCQVILHYIDMESLKLGVLNTNGRWWLPTITWLAQQAGIGLKRAQRAIRDLARAGYIKITYRWTQRPDGSYENKAALREIRDSFFTHLGVKKQELETDRHRARKKRDLRPPIIEGIGQGYAGFNDLKVRLLKQISPRFKPPDKKFLKV